MRLWILPIAWLLVPAVSAADECRLADVSFPGYTATLVALEPDVGRPPAEVIYCGGEYPRWLARWEVFDRHRGWRKYASAVCRSFGQPMTCVVHRHVAVAKSHEVIDLPYDIPIERVIALFRTAKARRPASEVAAIEHVAVDDGGTWSEEAYGYRIFYLEPPDYSGGTVLVLQRRCNDGCKWEPPRLERSGRWTLGDRWLRDERRRLRNPLIEVLVP